MLRVGGARFALALASAALGGGWPVAPPAAGAAAPPLRWGGDAEGGAPFVEADPLDPTVVRGFEVEVAGEIARRLGRAPQFVQVAYAAIDQSVERGDFELGMSGVEHTAARAAAHRTSVPYFELREVLAVRVEDRERFRSLEELRHRRVGTLGGTIAYDLLLAHRPRLGLTVVSYDDDVHPYTDLAQRRLDAVLLDHIIAERALARGPQGLVVQPQSVAVGHYVIVLARRATELQRRVDEALRAMMREGALERIYRRWGIWDRGQQRLFDRVLSGAPPPPFDSAALTASGRSGAPISALGRAWRYGPALLRAAAITLVLSCLAMALAVALGTAIASGRIYGGRGLGALLGLYVEVVRGTPLLLQLFVLYYGLSAVLPLPAFAAALLGLALNYAAYESEIYRGALLAVPRGQLEAARTLGLREIQIFRLVRAPQAFRLALPPMTNDFVALLKDSSLVSVITVVELTKQTAIFAANVGSWLLPGALCAALYLAMSLPLARLARRLERRWSPAR